MPDTSLETRVYGSTGIMLIIAEYDDAVVRNICNYDGPHLTRKVVLRGGDDLQEKRYYETTGRDVSLKEPK